MGEFDYIRWIRQQQQPSEGVVVGIGDDAAVVANQGKVTLVSTDMIVEGVDFDLASAGPYLVGRKALAINVSDIAAMGCRATYAVAAVAFRPGLPAGFGQEVWQGMRSVGDSFGIAIVGGDVSSTSGPASLCVTILGTDDGREPVRRGGALAGDWVCVTGSFGGSILGHHLSFTPRMKEGLRLNEFYHPHAMIDVSDGLAADLGHILEESNVGAVIDETRIPVSDAAKELSLRSGKTLLEHALHDGEDFELLFTLSPADGERLLAKQDLGVAVTRVGTIRAERGLLIKRMDGFTKILSPRGFEHPNVVM